VRFTFVLPPEELGQPELKREILSWNDVDKLIDHLIPQFRGEFDGLVMITKGGLIPGGILSEAMDIKHVLTASVYFPREVNRKLAWPTFMQFPPDTLLTNRRVLIVNDIWANGRVIMIVKGRLAAVGCESEIAVLHYRIKSNLFHDAEPDYYGAITDREIIYPWESSILPHSALPLKPGTGPLPAI
jgi:hypoxanthine phosphoribosyltransferase